MKSKFEAKIVDEKEHGFEYGCCAHVAISLAFNLSPGTLNIILDLMKIKNHSEGLSYTQITKVLNYLCKRYKMKVEYIPNIGLTLLQYVYLNQKGNYIIMFSEHVSCMKDGIIYDSYLYSENKHSLYKTFNSKPTGFWVIKKKQYGYF